MDPGGALGLTWPRPAPHVPEVDSSIDLTMPHSVESHECEFFRINADFAVMHLVFVPR